MDDVCKEVTAAREKDYVDAHEHHCAQSQVDENLINPATELADENLVNPTTELANEILVNLATKLIDEILVNPTVKIADENLVNPTIELADEILVNPIIDLADDSEISIVAVNTFVNPKISIAHVRFDEGLLPKHEWLQMMQQRHYIDMMLFGEIISLKYENKVEDNLSTAA